MSSGPSYIYHIDATDKITGVANAWVEFAQQNQAPELTSENVLGKDIWSFIQGTAIHNFYQAIFDRIRVVQTELVVPFRCDSQDTVRQMELIMRPQPYGGIEMEGRLLSMGPRENVYLLDRYAQRTSERLPICSFCRQVQVAGQWLEVLDAVHRYGYFSASALPKLFEQICPSCLQRGI